MDIIELLILLAFILFPLLQQILEKLGGSRGEQQLPPEYDPEADQRTMEAGTTAPPEPSIESSDGGWSAGWGEWPAEELPEALQIEGPVDEPDAETFLRTRESWENRERPLPEVVRVHAPVVSLESLEVDREAEHRRLHARLRPPTPPPVQRRRSPLERALRTRAGVRQGVILAEVLGPPRSLSPLERSPAD